MAQRSYSTPVGSLRSMRAWILTHHRYQSSCTQTRSMRPRRKIGKRQNMHSGPLPGAAQVWEKGSGGLQVSPNNKNMRRALSVITHKIMSILNNRGVCLSLRIEVTRVMKVSNERYSCHLTSNYLMRQGHMCIYEL